MANQTIKGITIEIDGDATKLTDALKGINREIKETQSELREVNKLLKLDPGNMDLLKQKQDALTKAISDTQEKLKLEKQALEELKKAPQTEETRKQQEALKNEITKTEVELKSLKKQYQEFGNVAKQELQLAGKKMQDFGKGISDVGKDMTVGVTTPIVAAGTAAVKTAADFESALSNVQALSGATTEEMQALKQYALEMSSTTKFSAAEVADAYSYMALAGWDAGQMLDGLSGVLNLASAGNSELATTSDIVTDGLTAFGLKAEDAAHFADVLATAMSKSNTTTEMLGEAFKYIGPLAGNLGYSIEDVTIALGTMANSGIKASQSGTALRRLLLNMIDPSDKVESAMKSLGISLFDAADGSAKPLKEVLNDLRQSLVSGGGDIEGFKNGIEELSSQLEEGAISEEEFDQKAMELADATGVMTDQMSSMNMAALAGAVGMSGLAAIVGTSDEDWNKLSDAIYNADGAAEEMTNKQLNNLNGKITLLKDSIEAVAISLGDLLIPLIKPLVDKIQEIVTALNGMDEGQKKLIITIAGVVAAIGPVLLIIGKLITSIGVILTVAGTVVGIIGQIGSLIVGTLVPAIASATVAILASPITWIVAGITALIAVIVVLVKHWDDVKAKFNEVKDAFLNSDFFAKYKELWNGLKDALVTIITAIFTVIKESFEKAYKLVIDIFTKIHDGISQKLNAVKTLASNILDGITNLFKDKFTAIWDFVKGIVDKLKSAFNFEWKLPDIKLPHFSVSGQFSLNPPSIPKFSIDWYKKAYDDAYLLNDATIFGMAGGKFLGGGEGNGSEAVIGTEKLMSMISEVVGSGTTIIPVYIGQERIDEIVVDATNRMNYRSGGR